MNIEFPETQAWDAERMVIALPSVVDGRQVRCGVSVKALEDNWAASKMEQLECFLRHRGVFRTKAATLIRQSRFRR